MVPSRWVEYVGIVVNSIEYKNQRELHILCPELLPLITGDHTRANIKSTPVDIKHVDILNGTKYTDKIDLTETIVADYLGGTNNDVPDMHEGEQVRVLNYSGIDQYWWLPLGRHDDIRRTEHFRLYVADKESTIKKLDDDNTYYFDLDTKYDKKRIKISTSKSDGEDYRYFFEIDAITNTVKLWDDSGNYFLMDSSRPRMVLRNRSNTYLEFDDTDMILNVPRNVTITVGGDVLCQIAGNVVDTIGKPVVTNIPPSEDPTKPNTYTRSPDIPFYPAWVKAPDPIPNPPPKIGGNVTSVITQTVTTNIGKDRLTSIAVNDTLQIMGKRTMTATVGIINSTGGPFNNTAGSVFSITAGGPLQLAVSQVSGGQICKVPRG